VELFHSQHNTQRRSGNAEKVRGDAEVAAQQKSESDFEARRLRALVDQIPSSCNRTRSHAAEQAEITATVPPAATDPPAQEEVVMPRVLPPGELRSRASRIAMRVAPLSPSQAVEAEQTAERPAPRRGRVDVRVSRLVSGRFGGS
jgi:hypothetical protein